MVTTASPLSGLGSAPGCVVQGGVVQADFVAVKHLDWIRC